MIDVTSELPKFPEFFLVKCPQWCESGYAVLFWTGEKWEDENRGDEVHIYVTHYCDLE